MNTQDLNDRMFSEFGKLQDKLGVAPLPAVFCSTTNPRFYDRNGTKGLLSLSMFNFTFSSTIRQGLSMHTSYLQKVQYNAENHKLIVNTRNSMYTFELVVFDIESFVWELPDECIHEVEIVLGA